MQVPVAGQEQAEQGEAHSKEGLFAIPVIRHDPDGGKVQCVHDHGRFRYMKTWAVLDVSHL